MVNVFSADQNERMERLDRISSLVGNYLLRGYKMLAEECETCATVLLEVVCHVNFTAFNVFPAKIYARSSSTFRDTYI